MSIKDDKLVVDQVVGSPLFDMTQAWRKQYATELSKKDPLALDVFLLKTYDEQIDNVFSFSIGGRYLALHENEKLKLYGLLPLIARQNDELKKRFGFAMMNDRLQGILKNHSIKLSDFDVVDKQNRTIRAVAGRSDLTILDVWFVGCAPCIADHKKIKNLLPVLRQKKAELVSISNDDSYRTWRNYLRKNFYAWRQYKKPATAENIIRQLGIATFPTYVILDNTGKIILSTRSLDEVMKLVSQPAHL